MTPGWKDDTARRQDRIIKMGIQDIKCQEGRVGQVKQVYVTIRDTA